MVCLKYLLSGRCLFHPGDPRMNGQLLFGCSAHGLRPIPGKSAVIPAICDLVLAPTADWGNSRPRADDGVSWERVLGNCIAVDGAVGWAGALSGRRGGSVSTLRQQSDPVLAVEWPNRGAVSLDFTPCKPLSSSPGSLPVWPSQQSHTRAAGTWSVGSSLPSSRAL